MNIEIGLLTMAQNYGYLNANRFFEDPIFKTYIDVVNKIRKHFLYIIFRVLVYAIRMVIERIAL